MKKKIGLLGKSWNGENFDKFIMGFREIWGDDADIFVFTSHAALGMDPAVRSVEDTIYMLPDYSIFDAVIMFGSGMAAEQFLKRVLEKCREANVPVILQGMDMENVSSITVNNYDGMRSLCEHLIEQHQVHDVVFIAGTPNNEDSNLRKTALSDALEEHGYHLDENKIIYANWARYDVHKYLMENYSHGEPLPDAFVCANDSTALFALMTLETLGIKVPEDVIVTGFDNLSENQVFFPSVSSVDQRYREQGHECAKLAMELIKAPKMIKKKIMPCKASPGESCGCYNCKNEVALCRALAHNATCKKYDGDHFSNCQSRMEMCIMSSRDYQEIPKKLKTEFFEFFQNSDEWDRTLNICIDPSYKELAYREGKTTEFGDEAVGPVLDVLAARTDDVLHQQKTVRRKDLLVGYSEQGKGKIYIFNALRIGHAFIGYLVLGYARNYFNDRKYYEFSRTVSTALEKFQSNIKLISMNERLSELMEKDSLTNVKNRIAYDRYMKKMGKQDLDGTEKPVSIVMCDINNLKTINDSLGHDAGDIYIKNCCKLMSTVFKHSPIFRTGGDEFVILISDEDYPVRYERLGEMRSKMGEIAASDCPMSDKISIATGLADFDPAMDKTLLDVVKRADAFMYLNKAEMKARYLQ